MALAWPGYGARVRPRLLTPRLQAAQSTCGADVLYPNGRYLTRSPGRHFGPGVGLELKARNRADRLNRFVSEVYTKTASTPDGYDVHGFVPAIKAGSMSALQSVAQVSGSANLLQGGPMVGNGDMSLTASDASLGLIVSMTGQGTLTWATPDGDLKLVVGLDGLGSFTLTGAGGLSMIVPFEGAGSFALTGAGDLKGRLSMSGGWTPYTELSPQNLAREVWQAVAAQYTDSTTMGGKLNTASSGGVDLAALAQAVWLYAERTLTGGATPSKEDIAAAVIAAAQSTAIPVNLTQIKGQTIQGGGTEANPWGPG